jgi:hypothetical protein
LYYSVAFHRDTETKINRIWSHYWIVVCSSFA